jgi:N6-adenosine-specific RNA methylase IME4
MKLDTGKLPLALRIEIEENALRKPLTQSELAAEQQRILTALRKHKTPGQRTARNGAPEKPFSEVRATAIVGRLYGESHKQVEKRQAVVDAAEAEPERFGHLLADMDRSGRVNGVYKRLKVAKQAETIRAEPPPLPGNGPYRAGLVDIPWAFEPDNDETAATRGILPYSTLSIEQTCALPVPSILHQDAVVGLWVTNFILARGDHRRVLNAWGLDPKTVVTWPKEKVGRGHYAKGQTEHLVIATRGKPVATLVNQLTLLQGPFHLVQKNTHSAKPVEGYDWFESLYPSPRYFDLFSRHRHNDRWDPHGDEAPAEHDESDNKQAIPTYLEKARP